MKKIIDFFKNTVVQRVLLLLGIFVLIILLVNSCNKNKEKEIKYNQNISYYTDSLRIERNKVNELEYTTNILSASNKNLEELNTDLSNELKKEKGTVVYLSKVVASLKDSLKINNKISGGQIDGQINQDNTQTIVFEHKETYSPGNEKYTSGSIDVGFCDEYVSQSFISTNNDTIEVKIPVIDKNAVSVYLNDSIVMTMTTGLKENEKTGILEIFVRSNYPGFTVSYLDGAIIDPHKSTLIKSYFPNKKWGLGINFGIGGFVNHHGQLYTGIGCIIGLNYNFVTWNFKNKR